MFKFITLIAFLLTIPAANWLISNFGTICIPNGPCLIPVGFDLTAPSGVLLVGLSLVLRDVVHEQFGAKVAIGAILAGSALSIIFAAPSLALASGTAFLLSELADLAVYAPLRKRQLYLAVVLSGVVGSVIDSAIFLLLAFGTLDFIQGQIVGKLWMTAAALPILFFINRSKVAINDN